MFSNTMVLKRIILVMGQVCNCFVSVLGWQDRVQALESLAITSRGNPT